MTNRHPNEGFNIMRPQNISEKRKQRGQSLVETALILPVILILLAGVVEVSNLLITKQRIETAASAAARFAADGGRSVHLVALNSVTQTLDLSNGLWDIWVIEGEVNDQGNDFDVWNVEHVYGISNTHTFSDVNASLVSTCITGCVQDQILMDLQTNAQGVRVQPVAGNEATQIAKDVEIVAVYVVHDISTILGLESVFPIVSNITSIEALGTNRSSSLSTVNPLNGCATVFPLVVDRGIRPITESEYNALTFSYPLSKPSYATFFNNYKGSTPPQLQDAKEGYIYLLSEASVRLGWAKWNSNMANGPASLATNLAWPGNLADPTNGFYEVGNALDRKLQIGDRVAANEMNGALTDGNVQAELNEHIDRRRVLRVILEGAGQAYPKDLPPAFYNVNNFATFRLHAYGSSGGSGWILAEFISWDTSCGQSDN
jgi:hypothetical protein